VKEFKVKEFKVKEFKEEKPIFFISIVANSELSTVAGAREDALAFAEKVENIKTLHVHHSTEAKEKIFFIAIIANNELRTAVGTKEDALAFVEKAENIKTIHVHHSTEAKVFFNAEDAKGYLI